MTPANRTALRATIDLPPVSRSVPVARRVLGELLVSWAAERFHDDASLLVSELVTNVVRHVAGTANMVLEVRLSGPGLRVGVVDSSALPPQTRRTPATDPGGHGMLLVAAVADRWGSERHRGGKRVWFELRAAAPVAEKSPHRPVGGIPVPVRGVFPCAGADSRRPRRARGYAPWFDCDTAPHSPPSSLHRRPSGRT